jgi:dipeptidyl aminopeptidase/acylaminoacyl peptidase
MKLRTLLLASAISLLSFAQPAAAAGMDIGQAAKLFGARESNWGAKLSPSGKQMLFLVSGAGSRTELDLENLATGDISTLTFSTGTPDKLDWCEFASESRIVCEFSGNKADGPQIYSYSRLVTLTTEGKDIKPLGTKPSAYDAYVRQYDGEVVDWQPDQSGSLLIARNYVPSMNLGDTGLTDTTEGLGVDRVDLSTLKATSVEPPNERASGYLSDDHGWIRIVGLQATAGEQLTGVTEFRFRPRGSNKWASLATYDEMSGDGFWPVAVDDQSDSAYGLQRLNGRDALYTIKLDGSAVRKLIAQNDKVDIDGIVRLGRGMPVIGYKYTDDRTHVVYFDSDYRKLANALSAALPTSPLVYFQSASSDRNTLLIHASSDQDAGAYYLLDRNSRQMHPVLLSREPLENHALAPMKAVIYPAADGTMIPAYVTLAADASAGPRPAVVLPHGGPSARDEWGFDWLAQFFAARGYVVIQPNYRGSSGYGADFAGANAFRDWRKAMSDVEDAAGYLAKQGFADPNRMAIVGWSYGGYAALESAVLHPDRYKAVVAIAPVTDLNALKRDASGFTNARLTKQLIGPSDDARQGSPYQNAEKITAPVLLVHGDLDDNVLFVHSQRMADALRKNHKVVELLKFHGLDHALDDSDARTQMLARIGELLDRTIGH